MTHPAVARATPAHRGRVITTVVTAFAADPAFRYFFPDDDTYHEQAATFVAYLFDRRVHHGTTLIIEDGAAVAIWVPPTGDSADGQSSLELPAATMTRLDTYDAVVHAALPREPHWYLGILATHPDHAHRRWGRALMAAGVAHAASGGLPAYLETTNPRNVEMYRREGWEVTDTVTVQSLTVWIMRSFRPAPTLR